LFGGLAPTPNGTPFHPGPPRDRLGSGQDERAAGGLQGQLYRETQGLILAR